MDPATYKRLSLFLLLLLVLALGAGSALAGTTGKISGAASDAATGEMLPGVNITISGTRLGAVTDILGEYFILNIPPGRYTVAASCVGYSKVLQSDVVVSVDHTTQLSFVMHATVLEGQVVTISAKQEVMAPDISNSRAVVEDKAIKESPVVSFEDLLSKQKSIEFRSGSRLSGGSFGAGVHNQEYSYQEGVRIRGGSIGQTLMLQDGLNIQEELTSSGFTNFNLNAIQSVEIITGGFNAEYGNVRSGVINVITKDGGKRYTGSLHLRTRMPGAKHFGPTLYDPAYNLEWQIFGTPESLTGHPVVPANRDVRQDFQGWNDWAVKHDPNNFRSEGRPDPANPNNLLTPEQWQSLWMYRSRMRPGELDPHKQWDRNIESSLSGPLWPGWERITFFTTFAHKKEWYPVPNTVSYGLDNNATFKVLGKITPNLKLILNGLYNFRSGVALYKNPDVAAFDPYSAAWAGRYNLEDNETEYSLANTISDQDTRLLGLTLNHVINPKTFYDIKASYYSKQWDNHKPTNLRGRLFDSDGNVIRDHATYKIDVTGQVNPDYFESRPGSNLIKEGDRYYYVYDEAPKDFYDLNLDDLYNPKIDEFNRDIADRGDEDVFDSYSKRFDARFDLTTQINQYNLMKAGVEYAHSDLSYYEAQWKPGRNRRWFYERRPQRMAAYLQDKFEFQGMVLNAGLRFDLANAGGVVYDKDPFSSYLSLSSISPILEYSYPDLLGRPSDLGDPFPRVPHNKAKTRVALSPRLGVSFPFTASSKFYFNFGKFCQEPESHYLYRFYVRDANDLYYVPNPNLDYEQSIAYELGFDQSLFDNYLIHIAGFYRDQSRLAKAVQYQSIDGTIDYRTYNNNGYGETSGLEVSLEKRAGQFFTGSLNYDYYSSSFGEVGDQSYQEGEDTGQTIPVSRVGSNRWLEKPRPSFRANVNLHTPMDWGPAFRNFHWFGGWSLDLVHEWVAGRWFTYNEYEEFGPDEFVESNFQWKDHLNTSLKMSKNIKVYGIELRAYLQVNNLFNRKELTPDEDLWDVSEAFAAYMSSLRLPQRQDVVDQNGNVVKRHGDDQPGDYDKSWIILPNYTQIMYLYPREILFGFEISF
jgi:outer membrane receptor protein involved in Fe transport